MSFTPNYTGDYWRVEPTGYATTTTTANNFVYSTGSGTLTQQPIYCNTATTSGTWTPTEYTFIPNGMSQPTYHEVHYDYAPNTWVEFRFPDLTPPHRINGESDEERRERIHRFEEQVRIRNVDGNIEYEKQRQKEAARFQKAQTRSMRLLKDWLSPIEYNYLMEGQLEIPSKIHDDEVWIVKREAMKRVVRKIKGKAVSEHCIIPAMDVPEGDILLSKIILLKTNEEEFIKTSNTSYI